MKQAWRAAQVGRRALLVGGPSMAALAMLGCASGGVEGAASPKHEEEEGGAEVTPGEDLLQEHAVLERVLLVYEESAARLSGGKNLDPALVVSSAQIIRRFVEDYHEKLEEQFIFPRLEKMSKEVELVATLKAQHVKGRELTDAILASARPGGALDTTKLSGQLQAFVHMYRPHAAREGSVLLPAFRKTLDKDGYHELGEKFEQREHELFGERGFDDFVAEVAKIETALDLNDLAKLTPP